MIKIEDDLLINLSKKAGSVERKRINHNFHKEYSDVLQRMLNAVEPGSYIRPHKHENPDKREVFIVLKGKIAIVEFTDEGAISDYIVLDVSKGNFGVEIPPKTWHSIIALEKGTVIYEIKDGPYMPIDDKNFAPWAPTETDYESQAYLEGLIKKLNL